MLLVPKQLNAVFPLPPPPQIMRNIGAMIIIYNNHTKSLRSKLKFSA
jgi:hypothetical protein